MTRFEIINPHRWFTHPKLIASLAIFLPVWAVLVWLTSVDDHSSPAALTYWGYLIGFTTLFLAVMAWSGATYRSSAKNCVEVTPGELRFMWAGKRKVVPREEVESYRVRQKQPFPSSAFAAFTRWSPTSEHVELVLRKPVWFSYLGLTGQWKADFLPVEVRDLNRFVAELDKWLAAP